MTNLLQIAAEFKDDKKASRENQDTSQTADFHSIFVFIESFALPIGVVEAFAEEAHDF